VPAAIAERRETVAATEVQHPAIVAEAESMRNLPGPARPPVEVDRDGSVLAPVRA
jgi:hypothetical protein